MNDKIEQLRKEFAHDAEGLAHIDGLESGLREIDGFEAWKTHPVTLKMLSNAKKAYLGASLFLARDRKGSEKEKIEAWATQDAAMWLISLASRDVGAERARIFAEIERGLNS